MAEEISFQGFGPITQSNPTFHGGFGRSSSFVPLARQPVVLGAVNTYVKKAEEGTSYPWRLIPTTEIVGDEPQPRVLVTYGEVDGTAPSGMTQGTDYLLDIGNGAIIYLVLTFNGDGLMTSVSIGYATSLPINTDDIKYMSIGSASLVDGEYKIDSQELTQYVYTEQALYINNSGGLVYSLFADPRKIHIINDAENFVADINGADETSKIYLSNSSNSEYIEIKKDTQSGIVSVDGFSGSQAQNFLIKADDGQGESLVSLYDTSSENYLESKVDSSGKVSVNGYANNQDQQFLIESDSVANISKFVIFDSVNNYLESKINSSSDITSVYGYSDNGTYNFKIAADSSASKSYARVYGENSNVYSHISTEQGKSSVYGYAENQAQNYLITADDNTSKSSIALYDTSNANFFTAVIDSTSKVSVNGYSNNQEQQFLLESSSINGTSKLQLFDSGSANYLSSSVDTDNQITKILGYNDNQNDLFSIESNGADGVAKLNLQSGGVGGQKIEIKTDDGNGYSQIKAVSAGAGSFTIKVDASNNPKITLDDSDSHLVEIDIPKDGSGTPVSASWKEIDICVNGVSKKMKVLGTEPY